MRWEAVTPLAIKEIGHGKRHVTNVAAYGFPRGKVKGIPVHPFRTGDVVRAQIPKGKYAGTYVGRVSETETAKPSAGLKSKSGDRVRYHTKHLTKLFNVDGYDYGFLKVPAARVLAS